MARMGPCHKPAVTRIPLTRARADLGAIIERLHTGNERLFSRRTVGPWPR